MPRERSNAISEKRAPFVGANPSKKPRIGAHRSKIQIGGHRTQQILDMQSMIGNQATQKLLSDSKYETEQNLPQGYTGTGAYNSGGYQSNYTGNYQSNYSSDNDYTSESKYEPPKYESAKYEPPKYEPPKYEPPKKGSYESGSKSNYVPNNSQPESKGYKSDNDTDDLEDEEFEKYLYESEKKRRLKKAGKSKSPQVNLAPTESEPVAAVTGNRSMEQLASVQTDALPTGEGSQDAPGQSLSPADLTLGFDITHNKETEFDKKLVPEGRVRGVDLDSTTFYANESQRKAYHRGFDSEGKMVNKSDGSSLGTIGAYAAATRGAKADRHIFTMDSQGEFHSTDAVKENLDRSKQIRNQRKQDLKNLRHDPEKQEKLRNMQLPSMERMHHSSFKAGEDVAGAGELQVRDGQVELVSDASGHYQPGSKQMIQTVQHLARNNVPIEQLGVEFIGKPEYEYETDRQTGKALIDKKTGKKVNKLDADGNKVKKVDRDGLQTITSNMQASAIELLGYAGYAPDAAEERMRDMHDKKNEMLGELLTKAKRVEPIAYSYRDDVQSKHGSLMKELLSKRKKIEPIAEYQEEKYFGANKLEELAEKPQAAMRNAYSSNNYTPSKLDDDSEKYGSDYNDEESEDELYDDYNNEPAIDRGYNDELLAPSNRR